MLKVVPWINSSEFKAVYNDLFNGDILRQKQALDRINVWKSRCVLPVALESTAALFSVVIRHYEVTEAGQSSDESLRNVYSLAIIRFVNHITERGQVRVKLRPVHILAKELGVPEWIVNLRHDATHGRLPSLDILKTAADWCIQWLKNEYWDVQVQGKETSRWSYNKTSISLQNLFQQIRALKVDFFKSNTKKLHKLLHKVETAVLSNRLEAVVQFSELIINEVNKNTDPNDILSIYNSVFTIYHNAGLTLQLLKQLPITEGYHRIIVSLLSQLADTENKSKTEECINHILNRPDQYSVFLLLSKLDLYNLLPKHKAYQLTELLRLTEGSEISDSPSNKFYSVSDIEEANQSVEKSNWTVCSDYNDWHQIPLGSLSDHPVTHSNLMLSNREQIEDEMETSQENYSDDCLNIGEFEVTKSPTVGYWSEEDLNRIQNLIQIF